MAATGWRAIRTISALEVIRTIDGPIILTQCFTEHAEPVSATRARCARCASRCARCTKESCGCCPDISVSDLSQDEMPIPILASSIRNTGIQIGRLETESR